MFEKLFNCYYKIVLRISYYILHDRDLSLDSTQETFIKIYEKIDNIYDKNEEELIKWIYVVARNSAINIYRERKRTYTRELFCNEIYNEKEATIIEDTIPEQIFEMNEFKRDLSKIINEMDFKYRDILLLKYYFDLSNKEIVKLLNISESNVKIRLHRAKEQIVKKIEENNTEN